MATRSLIVVALLTVATAQQLYIEKYDFYGQYPIHELHPFPVSTQQTPTQFPPFPIGNKFAGDVKPTTKVYQEPNFYQETTAKAQQYSLLEEYLIGNVEFTTKVYQQMLQQNSENFVVSPISAQLILALTQLGAAGKTAFELASALSLPSNLIQTIDELTPHLHGDDRYALHLANKIYAQKNLRFYPRFKDIARTNFNAETESIDFENGLDAAREMNNWVNQKTNGKIRNLIDPSVLNNRTALVLLNAIYFKGKWVYDFDDHFTQPRDFHFNKRMSEKVQTMQMTVRLNYYNSTKLNATFVELPYEGENITMTIVLPHDIEGLQHVERNLYQYLVQQPYKEEDVHVRLPKFNISTSVDFVAILKNLGVTDAFDDKTADFSGISDKTRIKIDQVVQKAALELDEKGTIATAATYTIAAIPISALYVPPPLPKKFEVNHPFIYYIKSPAGILFVGRYVK